MTSNRFTKREKVRFFLAIDHKVYCPGDYLQNCNSQLSNLENEHGMYVLFSK